MATPIVAGCDIGSVSGKAVLFDGSKVLASAVVPGRTLPSKTASEVLTEAAKQAGVAVKDICCVVGTGYGRVQVPNVDKTVSEIACHARGAAWMCRDVGLLIDVGGQDSKVIALIPDGSGKVMDFAMNDKCAAGTGRFLQVMARVLETPIESFGEKAVDAKRVLGISSQCSVFAESEVVCLIAEGHDIGEISAGIFDAVALRVASLVSRVGLKEKVYMSGGVAKNVGVRLALERRLGVKLHQLPLNPVITGALGAAVFAMEYFQEQEQKAQTARAV